MTELRALGTATPPREAASGRIRMCGPTAVASGSDDYSAGSQAGATGPSGSQRASGPRGASQGRGAVAGGKGAVGGGCAPSRAPGLFRKLPARCSHRAAFGLAPSAVVGPGRGAGAPRTSRALEGLPLPEESLELRRPILVRPPRSEVTRFVRGGPAEHTSRDFGRMGRGLLVLCALCR